MSTHGIEIAEKNYRPLLIGGSQIGEHLLHHILCTTIWIGNALANRGILGDGNGISTIHSGRRRED